MEAYQRFYQRILETYEPVPLYFHLLGHSALAYASNRDSLLAELRQPPRETVWGWLPPRLRFPSVDLMVHALDDQGTKIEPTKMFCSIKSGMDEFSLQCMDYEARENIRVDIGDCTFMITAHARHLDAGYLDLTITPDPRH